MGGYHWSCCLEKMALLPLEEPSFDPWCLGLGGVPCATMEEKLERNQMRSYTWPEQVLHGSDPMWNNLIGSTLFVISQAESFCVHYRYF